MFLSKNTSFHHFLVARSPQILTEHRWVDGSSRRMASRIREAEPQTRGSIGSSTGLLIFRDVSDLIPDRMVWDIRLEPMTLTILRKTDVEESLAKERKHNYDQDMRESCDTLQGVVVGKRDKL